MPKDSMSQEIFLKKIFLSELNKASKGLKVDEMQKRKHVAPGPVLFFSTGDCRALPAQLSRSTHAAAMLSARKARPLAPRAARCLGIYDGG